MTEKLDKKPKWQLTLIKEISGKVERNTLGYSFDSKYEAKKKAKRALVDGDYDTFEITLKE